MNKTIRLLGIVGTLALAGCGRNTETEDTNPNFSTAVVSIGVKNGTNTFYVMDDDRDGIADYIAQKGAQGFRGSVLFVKNADYIPQIQYFQKDSSTRVMTPEIQREANEALRNQRDLSQSIYNSRVQNKVK